MIRERNILLTIEYDGSGFFGWQKQPSVRTVQGELERVLSAVCGSEVKLNGTSRTDAGVHALGQRASFKGDPKEEVQKMLQSGKISQQQLNQVQQMAGQFQHMLKGIK